MKIFSHVGVSLDGYVANKDGRPAWDFAPKGGDEAHGVPASFSRANAIVIGRTSFDQGLPGWSKDWPYRGKRVYVLSSTPLPSGLPDGVEAVTDGLDALIARLTAGEGSALVLGGAKIIQGFLARNAFDEFGICVLPVCLGSGVPLFAGEVVDFSPQRWDKTDQEALAVPQRSLSLRSHQRYADGAVDLVYETVS